MSERRRSRRTETEDSGCADKEVQVTLEIPEEVQAENTPEPAPAPEVQDTAEVQENTGEPYSFIFRGTVVKINPCMSTKDELTRILSGARGKRAVPTLVSYMSVTSDAERSALIDVNSTLLSTAWEVFCIKEKSPTPENFLNMVREILSGPVPRLFCNVSHVVLKKP